MSAWILALRELVAAGGEARCTDFGDSRGRDTLARMGLAVRLKTGHRRWNAPRRRPMLRWRLTLFGRDVAEGRIMRVRSEGLHWRATWIAPVLALNERRRACNV